MNRDDLIREIQKVVDVMEVVDRHFAHEAEMNAALHMSAAVRPAPLASAVRTAIGSLVQLQEDLRAEEPG